MHVAMKEGYIDDKLSFGGKRGILEWAILAIRIHFHHVVNIVPVPQNV